VFIQGFEFTMKDIILKNIVKMKGEYYLLEVMFHF